MRDRLRQATPHARAGHAVGAAFLHPLPKASQVKYILGSAAHAARAFEHSAGDDPAVGHDQIAQSRNLAPPVVVDVLRRYPSAPPGGGRVGELIRTLDASLRQPATDYERHEVEEAAAVLRKVRAGASRPQLPISRRAACDLRPLAGQGLRVMITAIRS
jgi:hypothetical protein